MKITSKLFLAAALLFGASLMTWSEARADEGGCPDEECTMRSDGYVWCCARKSVTPCDYYNDQQWCYQVPRLAD